MAKFCSKCGNKLEINSEFCSKCGNNATQNTKVYNNNYNHKSKVLAGILGILLGALGVHNFYLGYNSKAVGQLLITILSCGTLSVISGVWGLIEGIMILTGNINVDANGEPLTD